MPSCFFASSRSFLSCAFCACSWVRSVAICWSCCMSFALAPPPLRSTWAATGPQRSVPANNANPIARRAVATCGCSSESCIEIQLPDIETEARTIDLVRAHVTQPQPGILRKAERSPHVIAARVRSASMEIGVGPRVQHGIALDIAIANSAAPPRELIDDGIAKTNLADVTRVFGGRRRLQRQGIHVRLLVR